DRLEVALARLLRRTARRISFDQEQLGPREILRRAIGELARQRGAGGQLLALDALSLLEAHHRLLDADARDALSFRGVVVEPDRERVLRHPGNECRGFAR